jgi:hypothetical protein
VCAIYVVLRIKLLEPVLELAKLGGDQRIDVLRRDRLSVDRRDDAAGSRFGCAATVA